METKLKYYTPELEEFHIGFDYEYKSERYLGFLDSTNGEWKQESFTASCCEGFDEEVNNIEKLIKTKEIRVKYLDKEDIETLGWYHNPKISSDYFKKEEFVLRFKNNKISIYLYDEYTIDKPLIRSLNIKNKSELKRLMTQLGILTQ